jgi:peptidyl-prolyl cis-trans isomerase SurA
MVNSQEFLMLKRLTATLVAPAAIVAVVGTTVPLAAQVVIEQVLVKVNGDIVTKSDLEARQIAVLRNRPELANVTPDSPELRRALAEVTPQVVLDAVDELLLIQRGRELGLVLGDEQFNSIVDNIKKSNNLEDEARFQEALRQEGMTIADLRRSLERQMLVSEVTRREVLDKISVTEEEARDFYNANRQQFTTPVDVTLREILIAVPAAGQGLTAAIDDDAKMRADQARARLVAGEPFARVAAEISNAPSKANGGLVGPIALSELAETLQSQINGMQVGDITPVTRTARGYQILKLESRSNTSVQPFEEAREAITNQIGERKLAAERQRYVERLRAQATIDFKDEAIKRAYDQALAARQPQQQG